MYIFICGYKYIYKDITSVYCSESRSDHINGN